MPAIWSPALRTNRHSLANSLTCPLPRDAPEACSQGHTRSELSRKWLCLTGVWSGYRASGDKGRRGRTALRGESSRRVTNPIPRRLDQPPWSKFLREPRKGRGRHDGAATLRSQPTTCNRIEGRPSRRMRRPAILGWSDGTRWESGETACTRTERTWSSDRLVDPTGCASARPPGSEIHPGGDGSNTCTRSGWHRNGNSVPERKRTGSHESKSKGSHQDAAGETP